MCHCGLLTGPPAAWTGRPTLFCLRFVSVRQVLRVAAYDSAVSFLLAVRLARVGDVVQMARVHVRC